MTPNYLLPILKDFFKEMAGIEGKLFIFKGFIGNFKRSLLSNNPVDRQLMSMTTTFRDLSLINSNWNLFETGFSRNVQVSTLENEINDVLSWEFGLTLSQSYEIFETFLINILTELLCHHQDLFAKLKIAVEPEHLSNHGIRERIKSTIGREKNNKGLIKAIRKLSGYYKKYETKNIWNINVSVWFNLLSEIRHHVVHGRQRMTDAITQLIAAPENAKLFGIYFEKKVVHSTKMLFMDEAKLNLNIDLLSGFAHLIFKSLSVDFELNPNYTG